MFEKTRSADVLLQVKGCRWFLLIKERLNKSLEMYHTDMLSVEAPKYT